MKVKIFTPDLNGRISFTKEELQQLLDEVYREGYNDARPYYYWTTPYTNITTSNPRLENNITWASSSISSTATSSNATWTNGGDIPEPQSYQIKYTSVESAGGNSATAGEA